MRLLDRRMTLDGYRGGYGVEYWGKELLGLQLAAAKQVARATAGSRLASVQTAEDRTLFWQTAKNDRHALLKAAYWMAVASRLMGSRSLAVSAAGQLARMTTFTAWGSGQIQSIYTGAGRTIAAAASAAGQSNNRQIIAVLRILSYHSTPEVIEQQKQIAWEKGPGGTILDPIVKTGQDVFKFAEWMSFLITGQPLPPGWTSGTAKAVRYGVFGLLGLSVVTKFIGAVRGPRGS